MANVVEFLIKINQNATAQMKLVQSSMVATEKTAKSLSQRLNDIPKALTGFSGMELGFAGLLAGGVSFVRESTKMYDEAAKNQAQLMASIQSTGGAANRTMEQLNKQAEAMMNKTIFDDDDITKAQSILLTFTSIKDTVFDQAIPAIADLATKLGTDLQSATLQVGKALNQPAEGFTALKRAGIQFSDQQEQQIKQFVKNGNTQAAQLIMLKELQTQFGGSAEAAAKAGMGPMQQLMVMWGNFKESIGQLAMSLINRIVPALKSMVGWMQNNVGVLKVIGKAIVVAGVAFVAFKTVMLASALASKLMTGGMLLQRAATFAVTLATQGLSKAMLVLNGVSKASVFGALVGVALAAVTAFSLFKKKTDETSKALKDAGEASGQYYNKEKLYLDEHFVKMQKANQGSKERNRLVDELKARYPGLNAELEHELRTSNNLNSAKMTMIELIKKEALAKGFKDILEQKSKEMANAEMEAYAEAEANKKIQESNKRTKANRTSDNPMNTRFTSTIMHSTNADLQETSDKAMKALDAKKKEVEEVEKFLKTKEKDLGFSAGGTGTGDFSDGTGAGLGDKKSKGSGAIAGKAADAITGGGKNVKQIYINIDSLIKSNTNQFTPGQSPKDATNFMEQLTNALQMIVNDTNYAV